MPKSNSLPLIVGVGASAGGLSAMQALLAALGHTSQLALVPFTVGDFRD